MNSIVCFEWHVPHWNFATMTRAPGRWAARHMQSERVSFLWKPSVHADAVAIIVPDRDAARLYAACRMSAEEMDDHRKVRAWRAAEIDPHHVTELRLLRDHIARGIADPQHMSRAIAERDRLALIIEGRKAA